MIAIPLLVNFLSIACFMPINCCMYYGVHNLIPDINAYNISLIPNPAQQGMKLTWHSLFLSMSGTFLILIVLFAASNYKKDVLRTGAME